MPIGLRLVYGGLGWLLIPFIIIRLFWRGRKAPNYRRRILERFGFGVARLPKGCVWVHAVSVGETVAAKPLVEALLKSSPQQHVLVTTMTPTGSERVKALFGDRVSHCYIPYDIAGFIHRFISQLKPSVLIVMETELWPLTISVCEAKGVPVVLANARLSERSAKGYQRFDWAIGGMFKAVSCVLSQTEVEAQRFKRLGVPADRVNVTGSLKYDITPPPSLATDSAKASEGWAPSRPTWIAMSTHPGEDELLFAAHQTILSQHRDALLILVPRHPERFDAVAKQSQEMGLATLRRSQSVPCTDAHSVFVVDTMGEVMTFCALADVAFVAGSLVPVGGHNPLEAAILKKPVVVGPHTFNFLEMTESLLKVGAAMQISDNADEIAKTIQALLIDKAKCAQMGTLGYEFVSAHRGATERSMDQLTKHIKKPL